MNAATVCRAYKFAIGDRLAVRLSIPVAPDAAGERPLIVEWQPMRPDRLSDAEVRTYRQARREALARFADDQRAQERTR